MTWRRTVAGLLVGLLGLGQRSRAILEAAATLEASKGFKPPAFADIRLRRNVRALGFDGTAFEDAVGADRYRWFHGLGNSCIATGEAAVRIADPQEAGRLLEFIKEQAVSRRRVIFFCACPTNRLPLCHQHEVTALLLRAARTRRFDLTIVEWPGGEPETTEVRLTSTQWQQARGASTPLGQTLPTNGLATLPWGSTVVVADEKGRAFRTLTGPACFRGEWRLPNLDVVEGRGTTGRGLENKAQEFRTQFRCNAHRSGIRGAG